MKKEHFLLRIDENTVVHLKMKQLENKLIETSDNKNLLAIDIETSSKLYELFMPILIGLIEFYNCGYIASYRIEDEKKDVFRDNVFVGPIEINNPTTIFFPVEKDETIILNNDLTSLNVIKGTIIFKNENSTLVCKDLENAKIINCFGVFDNISGRNRCIKGNEDICKI